MERAVPGFFGNGNMTFFEHMGVMVRAGRALDAARPRRLPREPRRVQAPDRLRDRRAQPDVRAEGPAAHVRHAAPRATARGTTRTTCSATTRTSTCGWARTPSATCGRPRSPSWSAQLDEPPPTTRPGCADLFSYPLTSALQDRRTRRVAQGVSLHARRAAVRERQRAVAADAAGGGDPDRLDERHRRGHARRADAEGRRLARARDDVPRGRRPRGARAPTTRRRRRSS